MKFRPGGQQIAQKKSILPFTFCATSYLAISRFSGIIIIVKGM